MKNWIILLFCLCCGGAFSQNVGGELFLRKIDKPGLNYEIGITNYWDRNIIPFNYDEYYLRIYRKRDNHLMLRIRNPKISDRELANPNKPCSDSLGVDFYGVDYRRETFLDPDEYDDPQGYFIKMDECCKYKFLNNIENPRYTGFVYYAEFPSLKEYPEFSSPSFGLSDMQVYCVDETFNSNFGAIPASGLHHKYKLDNPITGYSTYNSPTLPTSTSLTYPPIVWANGYNKDRVFIGSPTLSIDEKTGVISGHPVESGSFLFGMRCEVYKEDKLLGYFRRDFVIVVVDCKNEPPSTPHIYSNGNLITEEALLCQGESLTLEAEYHPNYNYTWFKNDAAIGEGFEIEVSTDGNYSVIKSAKNSCTKVSSSDSIRVVNLETSSLPKIEIDELFPCEGDTVELRASDNIGSIVWKKEGTQISEKEAIQVTVGGIYSLEIKEAQGCPSLSPPIPLSLDFKSAPTIISPQGPFSYCSGENLLLTNSDNPLWTYRWFKEGLELAGESLSSFSVSEIGNYQVEVSQNNCSSLSDNYEVVPGPSCGGDGIEIVFMPTAFSPNSDIHNQSWKIFNLEAQSFSEYLLTIFNRWGDVVFQSKDISESWDGNYKRKPLPAGVYLYQLRLDTFRKTGQIQLLR